MGVQPVTIEPGGSLSVSVGLDADGDVLEETDVAVGEAVNGVLPAKAPSLTLKFTDGDRLVPVVSGAAVELLDSSDGVQQNLSRLFTLRAGTIVARDVPTVLAAVRPLHDEPATTVRLQVRGVDAEGFTHGNVVEFRVQ